MAKTVPFPGVIFDGDSVNPISDNNYYLGESTKRWLGIFTTDLSVDGTITFGDATTQTTAPVPAGGSYTIAMDDDIAVSFGTGATSSLLWETADANANALLLGLPVSNGTDIPGLVIGDVNLINVDLTLLDGLTFPSVSVIDTDRDSYLALSYSADDTPIIKSNRAISFIPNSETDDYIQMSVTAGRPLIAPVGSYLVLGADGTPGSATADGDVYIKQKLEVDGAVYFDDNITLSGLTNKVSTDKSFGWASSYAWYESADPNATCLIWNLGLGGAEQVPVAVFFGRTATVNLWDVNLGLFDGLLQPMLVNIDNGGQYTSSTTAFSDAGVATPILKKVGAFANSVVGDIVRITAGTADVPGFYWITTVTSADAVVLDRNWCTGDCTGGTFVAYHSYTALSAQGILNRITDGAPSDANIELLQDGWQILDVSQANGRLYWRANSAWHYVDATAGISLPKEERTDLTGHTFETGDEIKFIVDKINSDGSFHAYPYYAGVNIYNN